MTEQVITVDVYVRGDKHPTYRVFVDDNLLTERDFVWGAHDTYIREKIVVNLDCGEHTLLVKQVGSGDNIQLKNLTVNGVAVDGFPSSMNFVVQ